MCWIFVRLWDFWKLYCVLYFDTNTKYLRQENVWFNSIMLMCQIDKEWTELLALSMNLSQNRGMGKREPQMKNILYQISPSAYLWKIVLIEWLHPLANRPEVYQKVYWAEARVSNMLFGLWFSFFL